MMRNKKTAPHTRRHHKTSPPNEKGLIAKGKKDQQSVRTESSLDNHFNSPALPP